MWTNTCCSHPLDIPGETGAELVTAVEGAKKAAQRKLDQELGIKAHQVPLNKFRYLTRIHYKAPNGDGKWGEHESEYLDPSSMQNLFRSDDVHPVDYILFIKADVDHAPNPNEVQDAKYVSEDALKIMLANDTLNFTPWFKLICESMLYEWWEHLNEGLEKYEGEKDIRRM